MIFEATEKLRQELSMARAQHSEMRSKSKQAGLSTVTYVEFGKLSEYHRGRADGIRRSLDVVAESLRNEEK